MIKSRSKVLQNTFHYWNMFTNINWRDVQRNNVVNNADRSSLRAPWQNGPYKNKHIEQHKNNTEHRDVRDNKNKLCSCI